MNRMFVLMLAAAVVVTSMSLRADGVPSVVDAYLKIQAALANDAFGPVVPESTRLATDAGKLGAQANGVRDAAAALKAAKNLTAARTEFVKLTDALLKYADATGTSLGPDMHVAFCPMENKSWVQKGTSISNPYAGKGMQTCGEIVKAVK